METTTLTPAEAAAVGGIFGAVFVFYIIFYVLLVIASWKIFKKAGEPGWKSIIPIYNIYILYKIVNMKSWFWWLLCLNVIATIIFAVNNYNPYTMTEEQITNYNYNANPAVIVTLIVVPIITIIAQIIYSYRTSKAFGHGIGYTIGLLFLPNLFWLILGFGHSKYSKKHLKK